MVARTLAIVRSCMYDTWAAYDARAVPTQQGAADSVVGRTWARHDQNEGITVNPLSARTFPRPPFAEYISGHSTFSAAGATILRLWTGSDRFGHSVTFPAGSSSIEPGVTPHDPLTLRWDTFSDTADEAGISRRYGGIHFKAGDLTGRAVGTLMVLQAWAKGAGAFNGHRQRGKLAHQESLTPLS